jgi:hypothetical protein
MYYLKLSLLINLLKSSWMISHVSTEVKTNVSETSYVAPSLNLKQQTYEISETNLTRLIIQHFATN